MKKILSEIYYEMFTVKSRSDHKKEEFIQTVERFGHNVRRYVLDIA